MMKGFMYQAPPPVAEENMSNLTSASGEASVSSSSNRTEQYFTTPLPNNNQTQPSVKKKRNLPGNPDPDAEVIALSPKTLMATNRFVCEICNKGFQRDQNLQLHRRGHNLPWKLKQRTSKEVRKKVYVCPEASCVHHDPSRALGDLTGIKKHFCRKHGEKKWKCEKCSKRYAVQSDWKAHSKTCGTREYRCDCGTLFSRRDSFITHRAFCDALAEESARAINNTTATTAANPLLLTSHSHPHLQQPPTSPSLSHLNLPPQQFTAAATAHDLHHAAVLSLKKEPHSFRPEIPPWLAPPPILCGGGGNGNGLSSSSSSSIFSPRLDQLDPNPNPNPNHPFHPPPPPSAHMSATALLQKAAQMGATMSSKACAPSSPAGMVGPHQLAHVSSVTTGFGLNLSSRDHSLAPFANKAVSASAGGTNGSTVNDGPNCNTTASLNTTSSAATAASHLLLQDMVMSSLSSSSGFDGSSFEDALNFGGGGGGSGGGGGGGGGNDGLTRDFLGLRAFSHSDILNMAALGNCMNSNTARDQHQNPTTQKPWQEI
ncbi:protein indeterminate-domain 7 isoform X2 [Malania oleifera]|uniref:protein indeterminate-domain 7 isoform X2 n=1 Tax=Malania oleifera TaxID=397392 RepID=UPI0025AE1037|nr:protein indeterminate-domain 7 isoform X2 [Malania oleifera]